MTSKNNPPTGFEYRKIRSGGKFIDAFVVRLLSKNIVLLRGSRGYVMCGYLNLQASNKFKEVAIRVVGVSGIEDILKAKVAACSNQARLLGIRAGQGVKEVLHLIA